MDEPKLGSRSSRAREIKSARPIATTKLNIYLLWTCWLAWRLFSYTHHNGHISSKEKRYNELSSWLNMRVVTYIIFFSFFFSERNESIMVGGHILPSNKSSRERQVFEGKNWWLLSSGDYLESKMKVWWLKKTKK